MRYFLMEVATNIPPMPHAVLQVMIKAKDVDSASVKIINLGLGVNPKLLGVFEPMELDKNVMVRGM